MKVNLSLMKRPLTHLSDHKDNFGFDGFDIKHREVLPRVDIAPQIQCNFLVVVPPTVAVVA